MFSMNFFVQDYWFKNIKVCTKCLQKYKIIYAQTYTRALSVHIQVQSLYCTTVLQECNSMSSNQLYGCENFFVNAAISLMNEQWRKVRGVENQQSEYGEKMERKKCQRHQRKQMKKQRRERKVWQCEGERNRKKQRHRCSSAAALPSEWQWGMQLQLSMTNHFPDRDLFKKRGQEISTYFMCCDLINCLPQYQQDRSFVAVMHTS